MAKWTKPSGLEVETNDEPATIEHCERIGWMRTDAEPVAEADEPVAEAEAVAEADEPVAEADEPVAEAEAEADEPVAEAEAEADEPVAATTAPEAGNGRRRPSA